MKDALAALQIHDKFITDYQVPSPLPPTVTPGTSVFLFGSDILYAL